MCYHWYLPLINSKIVWDIGDLAKGKLTLMIWIPSTVLDIFHEENNQFTNLALA